MRKVVSITLVPAKPGQNFDMILAVCDDGTLWWSNLSDKTESWQLYNPIPQVSI